MLNLKADPREPMFLFFFLHGIGYSCLYFIIDLLSYFLIIAESLSHEDIMGLREKFSNTWTLLIAGTISLEGFGLPNLVPQLLNRR